MEKTPPKDPFSIADEFEDEVEDATPKPKYKPLRRKPDHPPTEQPLTPKNPITLLNNSLIERLRRSLDQDKLSDASKDEDDDQPAAELSDTDSEDRPLVAKAKRKVDDEEDVPIRQRFFSRKKQVGKIEKISEESSSEELKIMTPSPLRRTSRERRRTSRYVSDDEGAEAATPKPVEPKMPLRRSSRVSSNETKDVKKGRGKPNSLASASSPVKKGEAKPLGCAKTCTCFICDFTSTRKWSLDRHFKLVHKLEPKNCRQCKKIFELSALASHSCQDSKLFEENNLSPASESPAPQVEQTPPKYVQKTPTKSDLRSPASFYSNRYRELLTQFSPTSAGKRKESPNLKDLLSKCSNIRNGKLDLNYVTPKQMDAVSRFVRGDDKRVSVSFYLKSFGEKNGAYFFSVCFSGQLRCPSAWNASGRTSAIRSLKRSP